MKPGAHRLIGELLDRRYRVEAPIARGGMSTVFRGLDERLDRPVAIKVMDPQFAADPQFVTRFEFEARSVARLNHPGLVAVYDQGHDGEHAFLVMELVEGGTLRELLRERGPMPPHAAAAVAAPVLGALAVAHRAGLVHRDIKPENILISDSGDVKIADFGLVRAVAAATTTSSSVILGTAAYLSPEQVTTGTADARSDVYAAGILLFEMLTGTTPFTGDTSLSVAYQRIDRDVPHPSSLISGVPEEFDDLVRQATEREPGERFADAGAMAAALRAASTRLELPRYRVPAPRRSALHLSAAQTTPPRNAAQTTPPRNAADPSAPTAVVAPSAPAARPPVQHTKVVTAPTRRPAIYPDPEEDDQHHDGSDLAGPGHYAFPDFIVDRRRSRRTTIIWVVVIVLLALAVGFGGWWMGSGRFTAVPSIRGLDRAAAITAIEAAGLSSEIRGEYSNTAQVDEVLGTDPPGGSRIARNGAVALVVSLGRPVVPPIGGNGDRTLVLQELRNRTFEPVDGGETYSTKIPIGGVAALDPAPGTVLDVGERVAVIRSKGSPPVEVPDVQGRSVNEARAALDKVGLSIGDTREVFDDSVDAGDAAGTEPAKGTTIGAGGSVTLLVSNAVEMPSLLGRSVRSAKEELGRLGLQFEVRQVADTDRSLVIGQNPGAGDRVKPGSTVTIVSLP